MKTKIMKTSFLILLLLFIITIIITHQPKTDIISWFVIDINNDYHDELLVITKDNVNTDMTIDSGEKYGNYLKIYSDFKIVNNAPIVKYEPDCVFDLTEIKPIKIQAGDINGDGEVEIAVCVYKTTEFHPVLAKRPFFYSLKDNELEPVWLGSRLARPFVDYVLFDIDNDDIEEIISTELLENGNKIIAIYDWKGFGFEVKSISAELEESVSFSGNDNYQLDKIVVSIAGENYHLILENNQIVFIKL